MQAPLACFSVVVGILPRIFEGLMNHKEVIHKRQGLCGRAR
jgi:hypothetical protein